MKEITKSWIEYAERDFKLAEKLLKDEYYSNQCVYHSQQSIEKMIKAVLEEFKIRFPKIHTVHTLYSLLPSNFKNIVNINESELELVDDIFIESKYPNEIGLLPKGLPTSQDARLVFEIAGKVFHPFFNYLKNNT